MPIDFTVFRLKRISDLEQTSIPGSIVESAAKLTHRHRQSDLFAIQIETSGSSLRSSDDLREMAKKASGIFFHTQGSVTRAIQSVVDALNKDFYSLNSEMVSDGEQELGSVNICVLHNGWLFIGQVGDAVVYHIGDDIYEVFGEGKGNSEKLGISRRIQARYEQCAITAGDLLLMSPCAHGSWKSYYLANSHQISVDQLKRRLHNQMIQDFSVIVLKSSEGTGVIRDGVWDATPSEKEVIDAETEAVDARDEFPISSHQEKVQESKALEPEKDKGPAIEVTDPSDASKKEVFEDDSISVFEGETEPENSVIDYENENTTASSSHSGVFVRQLARLWMKGKTLRAKIQLSLARISRKILPTRLPLSDHLKGWQSIVLIIFPVILIIGSVLLFSNYGKEEQYTTFMASALERSISADLTENDSEKKQLWSEVMQLVLDAEDYRVTNESRQLFLKAQSTVDAMDLSSRLAFRPAMTQPFPESAHITKIKDSNSGIYLLDAASGNVLRVSMNSKGFLELDDEFKCTPGIYGLVDMGKIVDFVVLPANNKGYKILAVDETGDLLYCQPGNVPYSQTLTIPEKGWGKITQILYSDGRLFVVDPTKNDILTYESDLIGDLKGIVFVDSPASFFNDDNPDIGGAIDVVYNQDDFYFLHEDGHMTVCQYGYGEVGPTECEDPVPFTDNRTSSENKKPWIFVGTDFTKMDTSAFPNPSIVILDEISGSFFKFSMQLNLENTYKPQVNPDFPLPETKATGFGVLLDQQILLAFHNQLFTAALQ
jgi:hypothetical protein